MVRAVSPPDLIRAEALWLTARSEVNSDARDGTQMGDEAKKLVKAVPVRSSSS